MARQLHAAPREIGLRGFDRIRRVRFGMHLQHLTSGAGLLACLPACPTCSGCDLGYTGELGSGYA
jgi:hypothetical protein